MRGLTKVTNERGFTFTESIFQLMIMVVFVHLLVLFFFWKDTIDHQYTDYSSTEWELFCAEFNVLVSNVTEIQVVNVGKSVHLINSRGSIDVEQSGTVIRKRIDKAGHIPLFTDIRTVLFEVEDHFLTAYVTMFDGTVKVRGFAVGLYPE